MRQYLSESRAHLLGAALVVGLAGPAYGQALNWEGQTGLAFTPTAAVAGTDRDRAVSPAIGFHVLSGGEVISTRFQISLTAGLRKRVEVGLTRSAVSSAEAAEDGGLPSLFDRGFTSVHAKAALLAENAGGRSSPAVSAGVIVRWQQEHLRGALGVATQNADIYIVATKTIGEEAPVAILLNGGVKVSNAVLAGIAGNQPQWTPRVFGSVGVVLSPGVTVAGEFVQQPTKIEGFNGATIPATISLVARIAPTGGRFGAEVALVRLAGVIAPGVDVQAVNRLMAGVSVGF